MRLTTWKICIPIIQKKTQIINRVAVQNERYEDWSNVLLQLRRLFTDYQKIVLQYHERPNLEIPTAINSTAAQGNFLEVLNMSLNGKTIYIVNFSSKIVKSM